jgi:hypothetical protein
VGGRYGRVGASPERIGLIIMRSISVKKWNTKRLLFKGPREWGKQEYSETILLLFRARAGSYSVYLFLLN